MLSDILVSMQVSTTKEAFQDLSLPIPSKEYLQFLHSGNARFVSDLCLCVCVHRILFFSMGILQRLYVLVMFSHLNFKVIA